MNRSRPPFFWGVVAAVALICCAYAYAAYIVARYGGRSADFGWDAAWDGARWRVSRVAAGGPADGRLQLGDVVLALDGNPHAARLGPFYDFSGYEKEIRFHDVDAAVTPYVLRIERDGTTADVSLTPQVEDQPRDMATTLSLLATSLSFFLVGAFVGLARPRDDLPRRLALASLPSAMVLIAIAIQPANPFLRGWESYPRLVLACVYPFHYLLAYTFFFRVVCGDRRPPFWSHAERALWAGGLVAALLRIASAVTNVTELPFVMAMLARHAGPFAVLSDVVVTYQRVYNPILTLSLPAVLAANYRSNRDPARRLRLKWIVYGTVVGLGPLFVEAVVRATLAAAGVAHLTATTTYQFFYRLTTTAPLVVPVAFAYAIARHRVLGVHVVVRQGLQYLLARNVLRLALSLPLLGLLYTFAVNTDKTIGQILQERSALFYGVLLVAGALSVNYRAQLKDWLDRRFFREAYRQERILLALVEQLKSCESIAQISRLVCERVQLSLHPVAVHVFYRDRDRGEFALGHSSAGGAGLAIPEHFHSVTLLQGRSRVLELPPEGSSALPIAEEQWFRGLGVTMVIAMKGADERPSGLLLLGGKMSEEAYSQGDRELLEAIAGQAAIVSENLWLKEGMRREQQIRRDVLAHVDSRGINLVKECPTCGRCFDRTDEICPEDRAPLGLSVPIERTLDRRYRLERRLGRGAMGIVYAAFDERLRRDVAVKILHGALFDAQEALRRFEREALASSRLTHAHVVRTYDYGTIGTSGAYIVMELLRGSTWRDELQRRGALAPDVAAARLDQMLDGLHAAHQIGLIHRDLKPENLMICAADGADVVKILDFGLAKELLVGDDSASTVANLTTPGTIMGTYTYMSPEQLSGNAVDIRSDLFAVGVIVVESLTGKRPFGGKSLTELVRAVLHDPFHLHGDSVQIRELDACLQKSLAKTPADRYPSAAAMRAELIPAIGRCPRAVGP